MDNHRKPKNIEGKPGEHLGNTHGESREPWASCKPSGNIATEINILFSLISTDLRFIVLKPSASLARSATRASHDGSGRFPFSARRQMERQPGQPPKVVHHARFHPGNHLGKPGEHLGNNLGFLRFFVAVAL